MEVPRQHSSLRVHHHHCKLTAVEDLGDEVDGHAVPIHPRVVEAHDGWVAQFCQQLHLGKELGKEQERDTGREGKSGHERKG